MIRENVLEQLCLNEIRRITALAHENEFEFLDIINKSSEETIMKRTKAIKKKVKNINSKLKENDSMIKSLYKDKVKGIINENMFFKLSQQCDEENNILISEKENAQDQLHQIEMSSKNTIYFRALINKYTEIPELTTDILHSFIDKIVAHEKKIKYSRNEATQIDLYFKHIGNVK